jgi:hypothetical protein
MDKQTTKGNIDIKSIMSIMKEIKEDFAQYMILVFICVIVLFMIYYLINVSRLTSVECGKMDKLYKKMNSYIRSINQNDDKCTGNLADYYIKTAYNCCSGGNFKNDFVNLCNLKSIINQGVRGLDMEIYSINDEPIVSTSTLKNNVYVKETYNSVKFSEVLSTIVNYAFSNSTAPNPDDPIILHLRVMSNNQKMYTRMASILEYYDNYLLGSKYSYENNGNNLGSTSLLDLRKKIVIIVDKSNISYLDNHAFLEYVNMTSNSMFMRALRNYDVQYTPDLNELKNYNKSNMTIALPDLGSKATNPNSVVARAAGCQMVAMCYQLVDNMLEDNMLFFDNCGYAFCLKPKELRNIPETIKNFTKQNAEFSYAPRTISNNLYNFKI